MPASAELISHLVDFFKPHLTPEKAQEYFKNNEESCITLECFNELSGQLGFTAANIRSIASRKNQELKQCEILIANLESLRILLSSHELGVFGFAAANLSSMLHGAGQNITEKTSYIVQANKHLNDIDPQLQINAEGQYSNKLLLAICLSVGLSDKTREVIKELTSSFRDPQSLKLAMSCIIGARKSKKLLVNYSKEERLELFGMMSAKLQMTDANPALIDKIFANTLSSEEAGNYLAGNQAANLPAFSADDVEEGVAASHKPKNAAQKRKSTPAIGKKKASKKATTEEGEAPRQEDDFMSSLIIPEDIEQFFSQVNGLSGESSFAAAPLLPPLSPLQKSMS